MWKLPYLIKNTYIYLSFLVFADNPIEENKTTVERLVEKIIPSSSRSVVNTKRKAKKLVFPGPTIQDSEGEYLSLDFHIKNFECHETFLLSHLWLLEEDTSTPSNQIEPDSEVELIPQKGKEREESPVEQNLNKKVPYPKGQCQKCA
ncbi:hypothetical protein O181_012078 [Austropuccinia psidii MF-1]|uniref:Uncharacterized protein n=1 Tax=Austropuccinia psidii MF-1 TaxID=1389203 RepID=A0A9Q3BWI4_9BASI|nr:hypothetical protein [Austropuccinia psidii MF-1]